MKKDLIALAAVAAAGMSFGDFSARQYVQDGLVAHWDAIENAGYGVHDGSAKIWKDLSTTGFNLTLDGGTWGETYLYDKATLAAHGATSFDYKSIEIVFNNEKHDGHVWLFGNGISKYCVLANNRVQWINNRAIQSFDRTKTGDHALTWVNDDAAYLDGVAQTYGNYSDSWNIGSSRVDLGRRSTDYPFTGKYYAIRLYNRSLTAEEVAYNSALDQIRFQGKTRETVSLPNGWTFDAHGNLRSADNAVLVANPLLKFVWTGKAGTDRWEDAGNWTYEDGSAVDSAPERCAVNLGSAHVTVSAEVTVNDLQMASDAVITVADGVSMQVLRFVRGGEAVKHMIFSGNAARGSTVAWVAGDGRVVVADDDGVYPEIFVTTDADGWVEFGLPSANGGNYGRNAWYQSSSTSYHWINADRPTWGKYVFPAGAKLRLRGYVLLDTIPAGVFSEIDTSGLEYLLLHSPVSCADGTVLPVPKGAHVRYQPGTWSAWTNTWFLTSTGSGNYQGDLVVNGSLRIFGDGTHLSVQTFDGKISGTGDFYLTNFGNQGRFTSDFDFVGSFSGFQNGNLVWVDTTRLTGRFTSGSFSSCNGQYMTNTSHCADGIIFGRNGSAETANRPLEITTLTGNSLDVTGGVPAKRWRAGGTLIVWGDNTIRVGTLKNGVHVVARRADQNCAAGFFATSYSEKGNGHLDVDTFSSGTIYASTNIFLKIGTMSAKTAVDYTYQSGAINMMTLDVTDACDASTTVKATDLAMLPARLSGFKGTVNLTDTATKTYPVTLDLAKGLAGVYNCGGCAGSGALGSVPASGTINLTISAGDALEKGEYGIARFTSGGEKLAGWTVNVAGHEGETQFMIGSGENQKVATLVRDATGLWLKVTNPGLQVFLR